MIVGKHEVVGAIDDWKRGKPLDTTKGLLGDLPLLGPGIPHVLYNPLKCPSLQGVELGFMLGQFGYGSPYLRYMVEWTERARRAHPGYVLLHGMPDDLVDAYLGHQARLRNYVMWLHASAVAAHILDAGSGDIPHIGALVMEMHRGWLIRGPGSLSSMLGDVVMA